MADETISTLVPSTNRGRYALDRPDGPDVTSGDVIALQLGGQWIEDSVEHTGNLYAAQHGPRGREWLLLSSHARRDLRLVCRDDRQGEAHAGSKQAMIENPTQTLTRMLDGGGRASGETIPVVDTYYVRSEVSPHSSRGLPDWQVLHMKRRLFLARRHLSC